MREAVRIKLEGSSDPEYRGLHSRLLSGITGIMGMRTSVLRGVAKDLKKSGQQEYIREVSDVWKEKGQGIDGVLYDEMMIWGLCVCGGCRDWDMVREYVTAFVPAINNWAVCDTFCDLLEVTGRYKEEIWQFIQPYFQSGREYGLRFGTVMPLSHYTDRACLEHALELLDGIHHIGHYVKTAVAWALSVYFVKLPDQVMGYLKQSSLDDQAYNKTLQKITGSFHTDRETKELVWQVRRGR